MAMTFIARELASSVKRHVQDKKWDGEVRFDDDSDGYGGGEEHREVKEEENILMVISE